MFNYNKVVRELVKVFVVTVGLFGPVSESVAQGDVHINLPTYDNKPLHYGFLLALNYSNFRLSHTEEFVQNDTLLSARSVGGSGFTLGFVTNLRLTEYLDLRVLPAVSFYFKQVDYQFSNSEEVVSHVFEPSMIEIPILIKYKSERRKNNRMYMVAGLKPSIEVGAKKNQKSELDLRSNTFDLSLEAGFGSDFYFQMFKFAPELRFSYGLMNLLHEDNNLYANSLDRMSTYTVTFSLMFE